MNAHTRTLLLVLTLGIAAHVSACAKPAPAPSPSAEEKTNAPERRAAALPELDLAALSRDVAQWRGLPASRAPSMRPAEQTGGEAPKSRDLAAERELLERMFFGSRLSISELPRETIARFDASADAILIGRHEAYPPEVVEDAVACALLDALELQHMGDEAPERPHTLDTHHARRALRQGVCAMLITERRLARRGTPLSTDTIAKHPDLLRLADDEQPGGSPGVALALAHHGAAFAAALFRAHGLSGLGAARQQPPRTTGALAQVERWMRGEDQGDVLLPPEVGSAWVDEGWREVRRGSIGGASTAALLEQAAGPENTRQISSLWLADHWRAYERGEASGILWVSVWSTPYAAQAVRALLERTLEERAGSRDVFGIWQDGVIVALSMAKDVEEVPKALEVSEKATHARARFPMRDGVTLGRYIPSTQERLMLGARSQRLDRDAGVWTDDELGISLDIRALEPWTVELSTRGIVRWHAQRQGARIQWTAEVLDPLGPEHGSEEYIERWRDALATTLATNEPPAIDTLEDGTLRTTITGDTDEGTVRMSAWQLLHEDFVFTLSITGTPDVHDSHVDSARAVAKAWRTEHTAPSGRTSEEADAGVVEFHVED